MHLLLYVAQLTNLTCRAQEEDEEIDVESLTVPRLKDEILRLCGDKSLLKGLKKAGLKELLLSLLKAPKEKNTIAPAVPAGAAAATATAAGAAAATATATIGAETENGKITILVLDERLHRFPFEGFDCFKDRSVYRVPSLPFAIAPILEKKTSINRKSCTYVLDPER